MTFNIDKILEKKNKRKAFLEKRHAELLQDPNEDHEEELGEVLGELLNIQKSEEDDG